MKIVYRFVLAFFFILTTGTAFYAQDINNNLRSLDNNKALRADTTDHKLNRAIKYIPLSRSNPYMRLSIGGEIREQVRAYRHVNFGDVDEGISDNDIYLLQRYLVHTDLLLGKHFRLFLQLSSNHVNGKNTVSHTDRDQGSILQAFGDVQAGGRIPMRLRMGRQELSYGVERILGTRDGANVRQTFDGLRYTITMKASVADFFIVHPVSYEFGYFDNHTNRDILIYSGLWGKSLNKAGNMELYFIGNDRETAYHKKDSASEHRQSYGLRLYRNKGKFYYDSEVIGQTGKYGTTPIKAWQISLMAGYRWPDTRLKPRAQVRWARASGDLDSTDNTMNLFRPITTRSPINDLIPIGFANIGVFTVEGEIRVVGNLYFGMGYYEVRRLSVADGFYTSDVTHMFRDPDYNGQHKGTNMTQGLISEISYSHGKHFSISLLTGYFIPGDYVENTGIGREQAAMSMKAVYRY